MLNKTKRKIIFPCQLHAVIILQSLFEPFWNALFDYFSSVPLVYWSILYSVARLLGIRDFGVFQIVGYPSLDFRSTALQCTVYCCSNGSMWLPFL